MNTHLARTRLIHVAASLSSSASRVVYRAAGRIQQEIEDSLPAHEVAHLAQQREALRSFVGGLKPAELKKLGIRGTRPRPVANGLNGLLYKSVSPDLIVKLSMDGDEYHNSLRMIHKNYQHIAGVLQAQVRELPDGRDVYILTLERLRPPDHLTMRVLEQYLDPVYKKHDRRNIDSVEAALREARDKCYNSVRDILDQLLKACIELRTARLWHTDLHSGNVMENSEGVLKLVDIAAIRTY